MNYVKEMARGLLIGVAGIVPGVSGGTLAVSMGVYDRIIGALTHLFCSPAESVRTLFPYGLGMAVGMGGLAMGIEALFGAFPFAASMTFLGLILGGFPELRKKADIRKGDVGKYLLFLVVFCAMILLAIREGGAERAATELVFESAGSRLLTMICVGLIASVTMVVPGVSGTMLLMMMGYYQPVLSGFNRVQAGILSGDWDMVLAQQELLLPFVLGLTSGIFLCARTMEVLLERWSGAVYTAVCGLVASSPAVILWGIPLRATGVWEGICGFLLLTAGILLVIRMGGETDLQEKKHKTEKSGNTCP